MPSTAPHPFTLRQLQYVVAIAEELSFRRAAERCHVSQPSLSAQVAQVEDVLGVRIFERASKRVLVTASGRDVVSRAKQVLLGADELWHAAERVRDPLAVTLRVGVIPTVSPYALPAITPVLRKELPRLRVAWLEEKTGTLMERLHAGEIDGALLALEAELGEVEHQVIGVDPFVVVMRPDHPLAKKRGPMTEAELRDEEVLLLDDGHCFRDQALEACSRAKVHEGEFRATSLSTLVQMVAHGGGLTLMPALAVETELARAKLVARPLSAPHAKRTVALVWRKGAALETALRAMATAMKGAYPKPKK
jgi:LysR family hydrogen peroxide-inducible transcriptional activator